ncbi:hypothetical protein D3C87_1241580 [compost metagenome]
MDHDCGFHFLVLVLELLKNAKAPLNPQMDFKSASRYADGFSARVLKKVSFPQGHALGYPSNASSFSRSSPVSRVATSI